MQKIMKGKIIGVFCFLLCLFNLEAIDVKKNDVVVEIYRERSSVSIIDPFADEETRKKQEEEEIKLQREEDKKPVFELKSVVIQDESLKMFFSGLSQLKGEKTAPAKNVAEKEEEAPWIGVPTYILVKVNEVYVGAMICFECRIDNNFFFLMERDLHKNEKMKNCYSFESKNFVDYLRKFVSDALRE